MPNLDLALIGNCSYGALIDSRARVVWSCMPRFDSDPVFCSLLAGNGDAQSGFFDVEVLDLERTEQRYLRNSAVLETRLFDCHGNAVEIVDFAPRFKQHGRTYRPVQMVRQFRCLKGNPRIRVRLRPMRDYGAQVPERTHGSNHVRYILSEMTLRLTSDLPVSFIMDEPVFVLERTFTMILGPDETMTRPIGEVGREFLERTTHHWQEEWSRFLSIPFEWQEAVIRAAITLKLCSFEESGAIIAAPTTSIPEAAGTARNWDYRFCWLRDAYFVVHALNRLGTTGTMEDYLFYITNVVANAQNGDLQPVYGITMEARLIEREESALPGYRGMGPVRVGNQAYEQIQNDVYGSVVLASTHLYFDERLMNSGTEAMFHRLERLGDKAYDLYDKPDAGLWELRGIQRVHTFSSVMCWAACDRLAKIAPRVGIPERADHWRHRADEIESYILANCWDEERGTFVESVGGRELDASLLLLHDLGFVAADDPRFLGTVAAVEKALRRGDHLFRYVQQDDFGHPENAFNICTFWYIEALAAIGRMDEARALFERMLAARNHLGLLSEDLDPETGELWGNFPQTYSMVGLISAAMRLSRPWEGAY